MTPANMIAAEMVIPVIGTPRLSMRASMAGACRLVARDCKVRAPANSPLLQDDSTAEISTRLMTLAVAGKPTRVKTATNGLSVVVINRQGTSAMMIVKDP